MKVMIVEDEMLLAMELESEVEMAGHEVTGLAMSSVQARKAIATVRPDFAFVDSPLRDGLWGFDVGRARASSGVPSVVGSGNVKKIPDYFAGALGAIEKPYTVNGMKNALTYISAIVAGDDSLEPPASLVLADDAAIAVRN